MEFSLVLFILDLILIVIIVVFMVFSRLVCVKVVVLLVDVLLVRMMMNREELECVLLVDRMLCFWMYCSVFFVWVDFLMLFVCWMVFNIGCLLENWFRLKLFCIVELKDSMLNWMLLGLMGRFLMKVWIKFSCFWKLIGFLLFEEFIVNIILVVWIKL